MKSRNPWLFLSLVAGMLMICAMLLVDTAAAKRPLTPTVERHVCPTLEAGCDHTNIQAAVDAATPGTIIKVAAGTYSGVHTRQGMTQTVRIDKSLTLQGGYSPTNWTTAQPEVNVTTVDGSGQGATILVYDADPVTIAGLTITGAGSNAGVMDDASAGILASGSQVYITNCTLRDNWSGIHLRGASGTISANTIVSNTTETFRGTGGAGILVVGSTATISNNTIRDNIVRTTSSYAGWGGGVYAYQSTLTLAGNTIRGNVANALGAIGKGGGLAMEESNGTVSGNTITHNKASTVTMGLGRGGGIYLTGSTVAIDNNVIDSNVAGSAPGGKGHGGGVYMIQSDGTTLTGNGVTNNIAGVGRSSSGGGLDIDTCDATLRNNVIANNYATGPDNYYSGWGGGVHWDKGTIYTRKLVLIGNTISGNVAASNGEGQGGGLWLSLAPVELYGNRIEDNIASAGNRGWGGGIYLNTGGMGPIEGNVIRGNIASTANDGYGGGLYLDFADGLSLTQNTIVGNAATDTSGAISRGGGIYLNDSRPVTLTNCLVADNRAYSEGSGLWFDGFPFIPAVRVTMLHTTLADNGGCGQGLYVGDATVITLTNTIISGHSDAGIRLSAGSTATLEATLWHSNGTHFDNAGQASLGTINIYDDPAFVGSGDYHLTAGSPARNEGIPCGVGKDIDGRPRPMGSAPDLGADEFAYSIYLPTVVK